MNKVLITAFAAAAVLASTPVIAEDERYSGGTADGMKTEGAMNPTAGQGAPSNQQPGAETSDRTPDKATPTPETQVDRSKAGETSDRSPERHHSND